MLFNKTSLLNIINYLHIYDILNMCELNTSILSIINNSKFNNKILKLKLKFLKQKMILNSKLIYEYDRSIQNNCNHIFFINTQQDYKIYFIRKCILCDYSIIKEFKEYYNRTETNWQYYIRNENIQHELLLRQDINKQANIMNILTKKLNSNYENNRYSYIRFTVITKINSLQLLILSYCDSISNMFVNKSWNQLLNKNKESILINKLNNKNINNLTHENQIISYKMNSLKQNIICDHKFIKNKYGVNYCTTCSKCIESSISMNNKFKKIKLNNI